MATITENGYQVKTQNEYYQEEKQKYQDIDPNWNLDVSTPDGQKLATDSEIYGNLDELAQQAYNSKDPLKATNIDLDVICSLTGTTRSLGTPSNVSLKLFGVDGTQILKGDIVDSGEGTKQFTIDNDITLTGDPTGDSSTATCTENGANNADVNSITRIVTVRAGWQSVTNDQVPTLGTDKESDLELRLKRTNAVSRPGSNQVDNTIGEILSVDGVRRVTAYENDTSSDVVDPNDNPYGLPANSVTYLVDGGTDDNVGLAIYVKKNPGCALNNNVGTAVQVLVQSPKYITQSKLIKFSRPDYIDLIITVSIQNDGSLPSYAVDEIKTAILNFGNGDSENSDGFQIGESVPLTKMLTPINQVLNYYGNAYVDLLTINSQTTGVVTIDFYQLARFAESNITVSII